MASKRKTRRRVSRALTRYVRGTRNIRNPDVIAEILPDTWTPAEVRMGPDGKPQIAINPRRCKNESVAMGFYDSQGLFHPIRASDDYDPGAVGERSRYSRRKKKKRRKNPSIRETKKEMRRRGYSGPLIAAQKYVYRKKKKKS